MTPDQTNPLPQRLLSLDLMRGIIMVLLCLESTRMFEHVAEATGNGPLEPIMRQLFHHPWNGLRFWDLIQPGFMFIAGVALAFSLDKQHKAGVSWTSSFKKALKRSAWLFFWGVLDYAVRKDGLSFELWDVLTQLSFTSLVAFLVFGWELRAQAILRRTTFVHGDTVPLYACARFRSTFHRSAQLWKLHGHHPDEQDKRWRMGSH